MDQSICKLNIPDKIEYLLNVIYLISISSRFENNNKLTNNLKRDENVVNKKIKDNFSQYDDRHVVQKEEARIL